MGDFFHFLFTKGILGGIMKVPNKFHNAIIGIFFSFFWKRVNYTFFRVHAIIFEFGKNADS